MTISQKLDSSFYNQNVVEVAKNLIGKTMHFNQHVGIITETEAYRGADDEASHAFRGPTKRSKIMFGPAGYVYVYLIYGIYHCLNIVTEPEGSASAVLIRGLKINDVNLNGPGKICKYLNINLSHNGINIIDNESFHLTDTSTINSISSSRIGIKKALDKQWRFLALF